MSVYTLYTSNTHVENTIRQKRVKCLKYTFIIGYIGVFTVIGIVFFPKNITNTKYSDNSQP